jgi:DNA-binding transcriptional ArsR family regulator
MSRLKLVYSQGYSDKKKSYFLVANFFLFFSNSTALLILDIVRKKEMTSMAISRKLGITPKAAVSKLKRMEREGILVSDVRSQNTFYRVAAPEIIRAFDKILKFPERMLKRADFPKAEIWRNRQKGNKSFRKDSVAPIAAVARGENA